MPLIGAEPYEFEFDPARAGLIIIDMQRDFLEPGGFGEMLGNDVAQLRRTIEPNRRLLAAWRDAGNSVMHTREGHRPTLPTCRRPRRCAGRRRPASAMPGRWAGSSFAAKPGTTSFPSSIRFPASR